MQYSAVFLAKSVTGCYALLIEDPLYEKRGMTVRYMRALMVCVIMVLALSGCGLFTEYVPVPLTVGTSTRTDVIDYFGSEPFEYIWGGVTYTKDTLPTGKYDMLYRAGRNNDFEAVIDNGLGTHVIWEIRFKSEDYRCLGGLTAGMTKEEVFSYVGNPASTVTGGPNTWTPDVFYQDIDGEAGYCYYDNSASGIRMFFWRNLTSAVYIYSANDTLERLR